MARRNRHKGGKRRRALVCGAATGAVFTYLFDPDQGRRRQALLRDKFHSSRKDITDAAELVIRDGRNRAHGLRVEMEKLFGDSEQPSGARMPGDLPALQGEGRLGGAKPELLRQHWAPAPRAVAGAAGGAILAYGLGRRGLTGLVVTGSGGLLLARAVTNLPVRQLTGIGAGSDAIQVDKSIEIDVPVDQVWAFWEDYEAFPTFMSHVRAVEDQGDGRSHWKVDGPFGSTVEWEAEVTERRPNEILAWRSRPGTAIQHSGEVAFEAADGGSRLHVHLAYNPAAGAAGHTIARLFGSDPKKQLDDDLLRMKTMIETGRPPHDAARAPS